MPSVDSTAWQFFFSAGIGYILTAEMSMTANPPHHCLLSANTSTPSL